MKNVQGFKTSISFLFNKKIDFFNSKVYINVGEENDWIELTNNSIFGYEIVLLKIIDQELNSKKYMFAKNANIIVENNEIKINTFSELCFYKAIKVKNLHSKELKEITKKVNQVEAMQHMGLDLKTFLELKKMKQEHYILKMKYLLRLREEEK